MNWSQCPSGKYSSVTNSQVRSRFLGIWSLRSSGTRFVTLSREGRRNQHEGAHGARRTAHGARHTAHGGGCRSERGWTTRVTAQCACPSPASAPEAAPKRTPLQAPPRAARPPRRAPRRAYRRGTLRPWSCQSRAQMGQAACRDRRRCPRSSSLSARGTPCVGSVPLTRRRGHLRGSHASCP
jgi:hypothetical protein